jgi:hypothetical protein
MLVTPAWLRQSNRVSARPTEQSFGQPAYIAVLSAACEHDDSALDNEKEY